MSRKTLARPPEQGQPSTSSLTFRQRDFGSSDQLHSRESSTPEAMDSDNEYTVVMGRRMKKRMRQMSSEQTSSNEREQQSFMVSYVPLTASHNLNSLRADVSACETSDGGWAALVITPIMRRAQTLGSAQNIIFVDSTSSCDVDGNTATILLTATKGGAVPVAVLIHRGQSREAYRLAFDLLKRKYPKCFVNNEVKLFVFYSQYAMSSNIEA
ncbi:hypothetical protein HPB49_005587 [Dermacentor silvarum]|uniref:Uncharacterized protein n=1 Tax=Dermacentor silvarum TaxID=543639 RepID=A0ACB8DVR1_DERSI|nr:hypothetical protein HPB49_005587 [Dermacentor silvarum]